MDRTRRLEGPFLPIWAGQLDCSPDAGLPFHLVATLSNGVYKDSIFTLGMGGNLTADCQASTPPALVNGAVHLSCRCHLGCAMGARTAAARRVVR
jgi:hypothetical protein